MRVLLICPRAGGGAISRAFEHSVGVVFPPLGLIQIAAVLREKGHDVRLIDMNVSEVRRNEIVDIVSNSGFDVVGISCISSVYVPEAINISKMIKRRLPHVKTRARGLWAIHS